MHIVIQSPHRLCRALLIDIAAKSQILLDFRVDVVQQNYIGRPIIAVLRFPNSLNFCM